MKKAIFIDRFLTLIVLFFIMFLCFLTSCSQSSDKSNGSGTGGNSSKIIDHTYSSLTDMEIIQAKNINLYFEHASVGGNINDGLNSLQSTDSRYNRSNFIYYNRGNPTAKAKIDDFYTRLTNTGATNYRNPDNFNAMMMKYCFIDNAYSGFSSITEMFNYYRDRMLALETQFPNTVFIWWTMPLWVSGYPTTDQYNTLIRNYCIANGKILFDIADIECHDPNGNKITDSNGEILYSNYASDSSGHLNATGALRVARAFWWMAYNIALTQE